MESFQFFACSGFNIVIMNNFYLARVIRVCAVSNFGFFLLIDKVLVITIFIILQCSEALENNELSHEDEI